MKPNVAASRPTSYLDRLMQTQPQSRPLFSWDLSTENKNAIPPEASKVLSRITQLRAPISPIRASNSRYLITDKKPRYKLKKRKYKHKLYKYEKCNEIWCKPAGRIIEKVNQETNAIPIISRQTGKQHFLQNVWKGKEEKKSQSLVTNEILTEKQNSHLFTIPKMAVNYKSAEDVLKQEKLLFAHMLAEIQRNVSLTYSNSTECLVNRGGCEHVCRDVDDAVVCSCYEGFLKRDLQCVDIDECEVNNGGCEKTCINTPGSWKCHCPPGYRLSSNNGRCIDVNECLLRNGHGPCQGKCHNEVGGYKCTCENLPGTKLGKDNHTCEDLNECASGTLNCSHSCINTMGQAFCTCPEGMELGPDWKKCQDIDECADESIAEKCPNGCVNTIGSFICQQPDAASKATIVCPEDIETEVEPGKTTAHVNFHLPLVNFRSVSDLDCDPSWGMNLSGDIPMGQTKLIFTARHKNTNETASCQLKIDVQGGEPPRVKECPESMMVYLPADNTTHARVSWKDPTFEDNVKMSTISSSHHSGAKFFIGRHRVVYKGQDVAGYTTYCVFVVTVLARN